MLVFRSKYFIFLMVASLAFAGCSTIQQTFEQIHPEEELSPNVAAQIQPIAPLNVSAVPVQNGVRIRWEGTGEDVREYRVYRKASENSDRMLLHSVPSAGDNRGEYEWLDEQVDLQSSIYGVQTVNSRGTRSPITESPEVRP